MSGLTLKGDMTSNTGEYLPAPYIDHITVAGPVSEYASADQIEVKYSIFLQEKVDQDVNVAGSTVTATDAYKTAIIDNMHTYLVMFWNMDDTDFYEDIVNNKINPLALMALSGSTYDDASGAGMIEWIYGNSMESPETLHDENGNPTHKYVSTWNSYLGDLGPANWGEVNSLQIISFTSTIDVDNLPDTEADINVPLLNTQLGDISHEKVFENGKLVYRYQAEYVDENGTIYNDIPLIAIDSLAYKPNEATHEKIVTNFQDLLNQYSGEYEKKRGNAKLKRMMDKISFILEVYGEEADLLVQLDTLRKIFPDKTPAKPIGKFYKSFSQRISNTNKVIKRGSSLGRKVVYNSKIIDLRPAPAGAGFVPNYDEDPEGNGSNYIYYNEDGFSNMSLSGEPVDYFGTTNVLNVFFGHFFFDYEKALRRTSNLSAVFDVNKLEKFNIRVPYKYFQVKKVYVERIGWEVTYTDDTNQFVDAINPGWEHIIIGMYAHTDDSGLADGSPSSYPFPDFSYVNDKATNAGSEFGYVIVEPEGYTWNETDDNDPYYNYGFWGTPYGPPAESATDWASGGYISSLVLRAYNNPTSAEFSTIENYRLMCFELLDYQYFSNAYEYLVRVEITDNTINVIEELAGFLVAAQESFEKYAEYADHLCSFNEDIGIFNNFFSEAMLAEYPDSTTAPWYTAPAAYLLHLDLIYDTYGGDIEQITEAARQISEQINPVNGTKTALENFRATLADFIDTVYASTGGTLDLIGDGEADHEILYASRFPIPDRTSEASELAQQACFVDTDCDELWECKDYLCDYVGEPEVSEKCVVALSAERYDEFIAEINDTYDADANLSWVEVVDRVRLEQQYGAGDCDPSDEYDLTPTNYPGGLCSENNDYNGFVETYIAYCYDLSDYEAGAGSDTWWEVIASGRQCKLDDAAKRDSDCDTCKGAWKSGQVTLDNADQTGPARCPVEEEEGPKSKAAKKKQN